MNSRLFTEKIDIGADVFFKDVLDLISDNKVFFEGVIVDVINVKRPEYTAFFRSDIYIDNKRYIINYLDISEGTFTDEEIIRKYNDKIKHEMVINSAENLKATINVNSMLWKKIINLAKLINTDEYKFIKNYHILSQNFYSIIKQKRNLECLTIENIELKKLCEYFYTNVLRNSKIFRRNYCDNVNVVEEYKDKVGNLRMCVFCGISHLERSGIDFDHFLPLEKFPYLTMSTKNLMGCCIVCNSRIKLSRLYYPILHPHTDKISERIKIEYIVGNNEFPNKVLFTSRHKKDKYKVKNYINLYNLRERYNEKNCYDRILQVITTYINTTSMYSSEITVDIICHIAIKRITLVLEGDESNIDYITFLPIALDFFKVALNNHKSKNYIYINECIKIRNS